MITLDELFQTPADTLPHPRLPELEKPASRTWSQGLNLNCIGPPRLWGWRKRRWACISQRRPAPTAQDRGLG